MQSRSLFSCNNIITFESTLYTTIPLIRPQIELYFVKQNGQRTYKYLVLRRDKSYFVKSHSNSTKKVSETDIIKMFVLDWQHSYICYVWSVCFSKDSRHSYGYLLCVLLLQTCAFVRIRQTSYHGFSRKTKRSYTYPLISPSLSNS